MTFVSFPGLFEGTWEINPVAFKVFGLSVHWYGLIICLGIILAVSNTVRCAHREKLSTDDVMDYALWTIPLAIIGARLYYVLTSLSDYSSISEVFAIWNGGLAIYGAVIVGAITVFVVSKFKKISFLKIGDAIMASLLIGQAIGRWGNFCNGEAFGHLDRIEFLGKAIETPAFTSDFILRMTVKSQASNGVLMTVHPTFLYESVWNLLGFIAINLIYKKKRFDGQIILCYLFWYGLGRFFIEGLRSDSLMLGNGGIRISQLLALLTVIFAVTAFIIAMVRIKHAKGAEGEYQSLFSVSTEENTSENDSNVATYEGTTEQADDEPSNDTQNNNTGE